MTPAGRCRAGTRPGFENASWRPVEARDGKVPRAWCGQPNEPIRVVQELPPVKMTEPKPGVYVFDLGQNMVGLVPAQG